MPTSFPTLLQSEWDKAVKKAEEEMKNTEKERTAIDAKGAKKENIFERMLRVRVYSREVYDGEEWFVKYGRLAPILSCAAFVAAVASLVLKLL